MYVVDQSRLKNIAIYTTPTMPTAGHAHHRGDPGNVLCYYHAGKWQCLDVLLFYIQNVLHNAPNCTFYLNLREIIKCLTIILYNYTSAKYNKEQKNPRESKIKKIYN